MFSATEVNVHLNEAVRLQCLKPSNLATLTWTSSPFKNLPEKLFIQAADGSLSFLATADTFGIYRCVAEEGKYKEVIASYNVRQIAPPRSMSPIPKSDKYHVPHNKDESYQEIQTEKPVTPPAGDPEDYMITAEGDTFTTYLEDETDSNEEDSGSQNNLQDSGLDFTPTSSQDIQSRKELLDGTQKKPEEKSYYSEMVVVSLLLAACICVLILGGLHVWRQRETSFKMNSLVSPDDGSKTNQSMESVPSLSSPEDPEVKVVE